MPSASDSEAMHEFEDGLVRQFETDLHGVLVAVITNDGQREWVLYVVDDLGETSERIHRIPQKEERYPIEIDRTDDPSWEFFSDLLSGME